MLRYSSIHHHAKALLLLFKLRNHFNSTSYVKHWQQSSELINFVFVCVVFSLNLPVKMRNLNKILHAKINIINQNSQFNKSYFSFLLGSQHYYSIKMCKRCDCIMSRITVCIIFINKIAKRMTNHIVTRCLPYTQDTNNAANINCYHLHIGKNVGTFSALNWRQKYSFLKCDILCVFYLYHFMIYLFSAQFVWKWINMHTATAC